MGILTSLRSAFAALLQRPRGGGDSRRARHSVPIRASYDAVATTDENRKHWGNADAKSPNSASSPSVRHTARMRARYERDSNCYLAGILSTITNDVIGTGPRIQVRGGSLTSDQCTIIESAWQSWSDSAMLTERLKQMIEAEICDGESFAIMRANPAMAEAGHVSLSLMVYEADQVSSPDLMMETATHHDGVILDEYGNPVQYHFLKSHPGSMTITGNPYDYDAIAANRVLHWVRPRRPGQVRGVSRLSPALPLFAYLRRYTLATIGAAEIAAMFAGVMESDALPYDSTGVNETANWDTVELERNSLIALPAGTRAKAFDAKQPVTQYGDFKRHILTEIGRSQDVTGNVVTGDSSGHNYSSGRLDHLIYRRSIVSGIRAPFVCRVMSRVLTEWRKEAEKLYGIALQDARISWVWDGFDSLDPEKDARTAETELRNGLTTYAEYYAGKGKDWEEQFAQMSREREKLNEYGLSVAMASAAVPGSTSTQPTDDGSEAITQTAAATGGGVQATALNGAQIASLVQIAQAVVAKQIPAVAAKAMIRAAFPLMSAQLIGQFIDPLSTFTPAPEVQQNA